MDIAKTGTASASIAILLMLAHTGAVSAQGFEMKPVQELGSGSIQLQVIGADPADPARWPATLVFRTPSGGCTATAVGPRVVLTAAHCVTNGQSGTVKTASGSLSVKCEHHPDYVRDISPDFALCTASRDLPFTPYERVNTSATIGSSGAIQLLGYGCLTEGGQDRTFGRLYQGQATVDETPTPGNLYTRTQGGAAVCFGDSGGGAYAHTNPAKTRRALMGVNSRGDISTYSWLSTTSTHGFLDWARTWSERHGTEICGIHPSAASCAD